MSSSPAFDFLYGFEKLYKADIASVLLYLMEEARSSECIKVTGLREIDIYFR